MVAEMNDSSAGADIFALGYDRGWEDGARAVRAAVYLALGQSADHRAADVIAPRGHGQAIFGAIRDALRGEYLRGIREKKEKGKQ